MLHLKSEYRVLESATRLPLTGKPGTLHLIRIYLEDIERYEDTHSDTPRGREVLSTFNGENKDIGWDAAYLFIRGYIHNKTYVGSGALATPHDKSHVGCSSFATPFPFQASIPSLSYPSNDNVITDHQLHRCIRFVTFTSWPGPKISVEFFIVLTDCFTAHC